VLKDLVCILSVANNHRIYFSDVLYLEMEKLCIGE